MNERIRELADEAAKFSAVMALPTGESGDKLFVEKFAELIVNSVFDRIADERFEVYEPVVQSVKKHFGVGE